jgi:hypothetical protein
MGHALANPKLGFTLSIRARCASDAIMILLVGRRVRFLEGYRPSQVRWGVIGVIVGVEQRSTSFGSKSWVRARFGDFITPWVEEWQLEPVS